MSRCCRIRRMVVLFMLFVFTFQILPTGNVKEVMAKEFKVVQRGAKIDKSWRITFNSALLNSQDNFKNVKMYDKANNEVNLKYDLLSKGQVLEVTPLKVLKKGENYRLHISKDTKSKDGSKIKKDIDFNFVTTKNKLRVTLDAGQTFEDYIQGFGVKASNINLAVVLKVGKLLEKAGVDVVYTRTTQSVPWQSKEDQNRIIAVNESNKSDLLLSINCNLYSEKRVNGIETYYLDGKYESGNVANSIQKGLVKSTGRVDRGIKEKETEKVLSEINSPGIMVHLGFLSNEEECKLLSSETYQNKVAKAIAEGTLDYYGYKFDFGEEEHKEEDKEPDKKTVVLNPGRVGTAAGIVSSAGVSEKNVNLDIILKTGKILESKGINVVYTIKENKVIWQDKTVNYNGVNVPLEIAERLKIANSSNANLMVTVGGNSTGNSEVSGIETYYYSGKRGAEELAKHIQDNVIQKSGANYRGTIDRPNLNTLKLSNSPSVWVASGFLTNYTEQELLSNGEYRIRIAQGIADGVIEYLGGVQTPEVGPIVVKEKTYKVVKGEELILPFQMSVDIDGTGEKTREVVWKNTCVDTGKVGVYTYEGTVKGTNKKVRIAIIVEEDKDNSSNTGKKKVVIDPGHGGYDPGAIGITGSKEKDITLAVSLIVGDYLVKSGVEVVYTRASDYIPWENNEISDLKARVKISNKENPNIFVSIHSNKYYKDITQGIETYYYQGSAASEDLARNIQGNLINSTGRVDRGIKRGNGLYVVGKTDAPSVLVELGFISNVTEEQILTDPVQQRKYAEAIAKGILKHLEKR